MASLDPDLLPPAQRIALNYAPDGVRGATLALFALDHRLGELVGKASEPLLGQVRLAWWRDQLRLPAGERARGDPVLDAIGTHWVGEEAALVDLVDGWEHLLAEVPLPDSALRGFVAGRRDGFAALARRIGEPGAQEPARAAAGLWALLDLAAGVTRDDERAAVLEAARAADRSRPALPRALRPLAILRGLALRTLARGGGPLVTSRGDILAALRVGMFGR